MDAHWLSHAGNVGLIQHQTAQHAAQKQLALAASSKAPADRRAPRFESLESRRMMSAAASSIEFLSGPQNLVSDLLDLASGKSNALRQSVQLFPSRTPVRFAAEQTAQVVTPVATPTTTRTPQNVVAADAPVTAPIATTLPIISLANSALSPTEPPRSPADFRYVLRPGTGFTGPTSQPAAVGNPAAQGYDAKAIARWDVVPYQTFDSDFYIGVVAFHMNDIDRVEFSVNGGTWTAVRSMTKNPQTDVYEYTATLRAADFADGAIEVRAVAYPKVGVPRVLQGAMIQANGEQSLFLNSNFAHSMVNTNVAVYVASSGSDTAGDGTVGAPYQTIAGAANAINIRSGRVGGATIYLQEGDYAAPAGSALAPQAWMTVEGAPGTDAAKVRIIAQGRPKTQLIHLKKLTLVATTTTLFEGYTDATARSLWLDQVTVQSAGRALTQSPISSRYTLYATDSTWRDVKNGPNGATLCRGVKCESLLSDAYTNGELVINCSARDLDRLDTGSHPDVYQVYLPNSGMDNYIVYGLAAIDIDAQGFFVGALAAEEIVRNFAVIDVTLQHRAGTILKSQWGAGANHVVIRNLASTGPSWTWKGSNFSNFVIDRSLFSGMTVSGTGITVQSVLQHVRFTNTLVVSGAFASILDG